MVEIQFILLVPSFNIVLTLLIKLFRFVKLKMTYWGENAASSSGYFVIMYIFNVMDT